MESHACSYHPVLVKTAKVKATSVAVEQQTESLSSVGERSRYDTIAILKSKPMSKQVSDGREQLVPLPYKTQEVTMCFENGRQTRSLRQDKKEVNGRHYTRSIGIHKLVLEAPFRLQMQAFENPRCSTRYLDINFAEIAP